MIEKFLHKLRVSLLILSLVIGWMGCIQQKEPSAHNTEDFYLEDYFRGDFKVKGEPALNQEVEVIFIVNPTYESFDTRIWIYLPEGIELIEGDIYWEGDLKTDEVIQMKMVVKPKKEGQLEIWANVLGDLGGAERDWAYYLYFLTSKNGGQVSRTPYYREPPPLEGEAKELIVDLGLKSPITVDVDKELVLTFSLVASKDVSNVKAVIELPEEFIFIDGVLEWTGDLKAAQEEMFQVIVKPTKKGRFIILGYFTYDGEEMAHEFSIFVH